MKTFNGVACTDEVNLYDQIFSLTAMVNAYEKQWIEAIPSFANHNHTKSIGYTRLTGIYIEPGKAYLTNAMTIGENEEEEKHIRNYNYGYLYKVQVTDNIAKYSCLKKKIAAYIEGKCCELWVNGVFIYNKGIVNRVFPQLDIKKEDGLIDLDCLYPVLPGVYRIGEYLICADKNFRRGYSYLNTLNTDFLSRIEKVDKKKSKVRISIDTDCIGLAGTEHQELEYQYWWGPKFDKELNSIPLGVTRHNNENYNELLSEIQFTEFGWYIQDGKHTFECEEVTDIPNLKVNDEEMYGCRFVHSMVNQEGIPVHLDGAIRAYTTEKMLTRLDSNIKESDRDEYYKKLWRIDGQISVEEWKELITHYYRDNLMVGEYFGGKDEKLNFHREVENSEHEISLEDFVPCNIQAGDGIRVAICFGENDKPLIHDVWIRPEAYLGSEKYVESETVTLYKMLKSKGIRVRFPFVKKLCFEDMIYNYPIIECQSAKLGTEVIDSLLELCKIWKAKTDDRVISFTLSIRYEEKKVRYSFLGHVNDFVTFFSNGFSIIPEEEKITEWLQKVYDYISKEYKKEKSIRPQEVLAMPGCLRIPRRIVPKQYITSYSKNGEIKLSIPKAEQDIVINNNISALLAFENKESICSKCGKDFFSCGCICEKDNVSEIITKGEPIGIFWANRSAYHQDTTLHLIKR